MAGHFVETIVDAASKRVLAATTVISLMKKEYNDVEALGCGVLLKLGDDVFLVSAAHLLNDSNWHELTIPGDGNVMITLQGELCTSYHDSKENSSIDFTILRFYPKMHKYLTRYSPFTEQEIMINHKTIQRDHYLVSGYPIRKIKSKKENGLKVITADPLRILTYGASKKRYSKNGFNEQTHTLVQFQYKLQKFGSGDISRVVNPQGISGSGLYFLPAFDQAHIRDTEVSLVGIMIENRKELGVMVAIRIDVIVEVIRKEFRSNKLNLPVSELKADLGKIYLGDYTERVEAEESYLEMQGKGN